MISVKMCLVIIWEAAQAETLVTIRSQSSACMAQNPWPGVGLTPGGSVPKPQGQCAKLTPLGAEFTNAEAI